MRSLIAAIALLALCGCVGPLYETQASPSEPDIETPPEAPMGPVEVKWSGDPRLAFDAALRGAARLGFDVTVSNADAGVLKVEETGIDRASTRSVERHRLRVWNNLTPEQQNIAVRSGADILTQGATVSRRLMFTVVASPDLVVVTPKVEVCVAYGSTKQCARRASLQDPEMDVLARVIVAIKEALPARPATSSVERI